MIKGCFFIISSSFVILAMLARVQTLMMMLVRKCGCDAAVGLPPIECIRCSLTIVKEDEDETDKMQFR